MTKAERFNRAYNYLKDNGVISKQKDVAAKMNASAPNVSSALKGNDKVLTDKFLIRFCAAFDGTFNSSWLLTGKGEMLNAGNVAGENSGVMISGSNRINNSPIDNRHYYSDSPDVLRAQIEALDERIKEKDAQIKEKDAQISRLLDIVANMK